jgi:1-deoxy-D-xylulose-5-phosphate reductoisomerase
LKKRVLLLGGTGSIGISTLAVLRAHADLFELVGITARNNSAEVAKAAREFGVRFICMDSPEAASTAAQMLEGSGTEVRTGIDSACELCGRDDVDIVLSAIVGAAALRPTLAAVKAGKRVALANKESLVMAGDLMNREAAKSGAPVIPVDSEHSAVFSCLYGREPRDVSRLLLTASGGPFRTWSADRFDSITPTQALNHPTWNMGAKITVDSATLFNKALELIEAHCLFGLNYDRLGAVIHPQSIVHAMVEFADGSVLAQLSNPDMRLPIQLALTWPDRLASPCRTLDLTTCPALEFTRVDPGRFPSIELGIEAGRRGGSSPAVLNAANEVAVMRFLGGGIKFTDIFRIVSRTLECERHTVPGDLDEVLAVDEWARRKASEL